MSEKTKYSSVLDKGYVMLVDYMGQDTCIADAARVSYQKGTKKVNNDEALIRYLIKHRHETPLEMVQFKFEVKLPLFVFAQWVRHRMSSYNVSSYRYSEISDEFYVPSPERVTTQSKDNKQGSSNEISSKSKEFIDYLESKAISDVNDYHNFVFDETDNPDGIARELTRIGISQNNYTSFVWSINLRALFNFLSLRMDSHAQFEIREYAWAIFNMIKETHPIAIRAFEEYILNAKNLSKTEFDIIKECLDIEKFKLKCQEAQHSKALSKREVDFLYNGFTN